MIGQAFGAGTHAEMPVAQAGASFSGGFATIWYQWKNMLITPFYWLMAPWYRRSERTTIAEMVTDRYGRGVGTFYTVFSLVFFVFVMGVMLQGAAKVIAVAGGGTLSPDFIVLGMAVAFMVYSYFGGLTAAAHTEFIQAILIIILSFMLIPAGLGEVGGFEGLHKTLPEDFFWLFSEKSGLGAFTIAMLALNGIVGISAQPHMMTMFASGNTERAGRIGQTYGNFVKRLVTLGWAFTGLIVAALVSIKQVELPDPEHAFGYAARLLLAPGLTGLMIACIFAANMSSCSNFMVNMGALFTRDIYQAFINPKATDNQALRTGRISGLLLTLAAVAFALVVDNVLSAFLFVETIAAFMGIMVFGGIAWRRANRFGAVAAVLVAFCSYYLINYLSIGSLQLVYKWMPAPFGWAMLWGFLTLIGISLLTRPEPPERIHKFFFRLENLSKFDRKPQQSTLATDQGQGLILMDLPGWLKKERWVGFGRKYREDWLGFLLGWIVVGILLGIAIWVKNYPL